MKRGRAFSVAALCLTLLVTTRCVAQETTEETTTAQATEQEATVVEEPKKAEPEFDLSNEDFGTYYDPQNVFCGQHDCYKILGFDYEAGEIPDKKEITKRYRALSRYWHPDKSKHKKAKKIFVKLARAYEVLTSDLRSEYDDLRYDPEKYFQKYGTSVLWNYAPKSDTSIVIILVLLLGNIFSWYAQKHRWQLVADRLIKAALEDWTPSQGGTPESKQLREEAIAILEKQKETIGESKPDTTPAKSSTTKKKAQKGAKKVSGKERKKQEQEELRPIVTEIVNGMTDFGSGFHQPTWRDLFIVSLVRFPFKVSKEILWFSKYYLRRLQKKELSDEERLVLTQRAVGPIAWDTSSDEEREKLIARELWVVENLAEWSEEQEFNRLSSWEKKEYLKMKKKGYVPPDMKED